MPSFDIVCELDWHEVHNAVDQANREVNTRFDFKDTNANFSCKDEAIILLAQNDFQLQQMQDVLHKKLAKRGVDLKHLEIEKPQISLNKAEQTVKLQQGINDTQAKQIIKMIKEQKLKVQPSIQGDKLRVTGKSRDDLQQVITFLKAQTFGLPLQFNNFRD